MLKVLYLSFFDYDNSLIINEMNSFFILNYNKQWFLFT